MRVILAIAVVIVSVRVYVLQNNKEIFSDDPENRKWIIWLLKAILFMLCITLVTEIIVVWLEDMSELEIEYSDDLLFRMMNEFIILNG